VPPNVKALWLAMVSAETGMDELMINPAILAASGSVPYGHALKSGVWGDERADDGDPL
jgi:hypothetical protein